jgi:hypothetical protein
MASIIRIKRSSGTSKPASLQWGEFGYVTGIGSYGGLNQYKDRIFLGDDGTNANPVGGYYYTSMMEHQPGAIDGVSNTRNQDNGVVAVMAPATNSGLGGASSLKVDQWNVDNLRIDLNTISSTDTDGDINLDPNGIGSVRLPDNTYLTFGDDDNVGMRYDEANDDRFEIEGADWFFDGGVQITINDSTESTTKDNGALVVEGGVGIEKNLNVGGDLHIDGVSIFDSIKISDNVISTINDGTNTLYIDPYPDGLSNEGTVIIKGDLQVDGTTTQVNSTTATVNDPIIHLGDVTSVRTVTETVVSGVSTIRLDSIVGINTGDIISGNAGLNAGAANTVTSYDTSNKIITLTDATISGIATTTQLTITHAYDTNTDRGVSYSYNTSSGTSNNKIGFFGLDDSSIASSTADADNHGTHADDSRRWTYIPDAGITNSVVSGTKGFLDVKGLYYQSGDYELGGVVYFDSEGLQRSTNAVASPVITSKQILTAVTKNTLSLGSAISASAGDIIRQDSSGAYGVVETTVSSSTTVDLIGVEGTFSTAYNLRREGQNGFIEDLSSIPSGGVTVIYTNKPQWTSTLDGGNF